MKQTLQHLLAEGKTAQVIAELRKLNLADKDLAQAILQTAARFADLERQQHAGTLAHEALSLERNKINAALLHLIGQLPDDAGTDKNTPAESKGKTIIQNAEKIYNIDHIDNANFS